MTLYQSIKQVGANAFYSLVETFANTSQKKNSLLALIGVGLSFLPTACDVGKEYTQANWIPVSPQTLLWNGFVAEGGGTDDEWFKYMYYVGEKNEGRGKFDPILLPDLNGDGCVSGGKCVE